MNLETVQIVIVAALSISTILVTVIGIQIILLLRDLRKVTERVNKMSSGLAMVVGALQKSFTEVGNVAEGAKVVFSLFNGIIKRIKNNDREE
jgi:hypothetical protein